MNTVSKNQFFDINKLPPEKGLLIFWLSISNLNTKQNPQKCLDHVRLFSPSKVAKPNIGLNFIYGDFLYLYSDKPAPELKNSFMHQVIQHRNATGNFIEKNHADFQIQQAFNYMVFNQLYIGTNNFDVLFKKIKDLYKDDVILQKYLLEDCESFNKALDENQINFFLEEALMFYLVSHNQIKLPNDYIENQQKWILNCYPGRPIKTTIYIAKLNPFKLDWGENIYQNSWYDLESKKLINFDNVDLETYQVKE